MQSDSHSIFIPNFRSSTANILFARAACILFASYCFCFVLFLSRIILFRVHYLYLISFYCFFLILLPIIQWKKWSLYYYNEGSRRRRLYNTRRSMHIIGLMKWGVIAQYHVELIPIEKLHQSFCTGIILLVHLLHKLLMRLLLSLY